MKTDNKSLVIAILNIVVVGDRCVLFVVETNVNVFIFMDSQMKVKYKTQLFKNNTFM